MPVGCDRCNHVGYKGRIGIYELLRVDESVRSIIRSNGDVEQIKEISRSNGMRLMMEDAIEKLRLGTTTLEEIFRVVPTEAASHPECTKCTQRIIPTFKFCPNCGTKNPVAASATRQTSAPEASEEVFS